jgi:toxin ParE1/3/4
MSWQLRLSAAARRDVERALEWSLREFGVRQHDRYAKLIGDALDEIGSRPAGPRSRARPEVHPDARSLHIARPGRRARHFFLYRVNADQTIDVARLLHDAMDVDRHVPDDFADR